MSEGAASSPVTIEELLEHGRWVRRLATSLVVGEEAADELAQASLVQAITHPPRHRGNLRAWLATITRNLARDRGKAKQREWDPRWLEAVRRDQPLESGDQIVARIETQRLVSEVLLGLEPHLRDVLVLRFYDELSYREIGDRLGMPADTARSRTTRGLAELRQRLDQLGGENAVEWRTGLVLWLGASEWARLGSGAGATTGGGLVGWAQGLTALQILGALLLSGVLALLAWAPWSGVRKAEPLVLVPGRDAANDDRIAAADLSVEHEEDRSSALRDAAAAAGEWVGVSGRVLQYLDRSPVVGARVRLMKIDHAGPSTAIETVADADGRFRFDGLMREVVVGPEHLLSAFDGEYVLRIETDVALAAFEDTCPRAKLTGDPRGETALDADLGDLTLTPAVPLGIRLVGDWEPSGSLWVAELSPRELAPRRFRKIGRWGESREPIVSDLLGAVVHREVRRVLVAYDGSGLAWVELDLPLDASRPRTLQLERSPPGRVEVMLLDGEGRPVPNVPVIATPLFWPLRTPDALDFCYHGRFTRPSDFESSRRSVTDERGIAVFAALPSGLPNGPSPDASGDGTCPNGTYVFCAGERNSDAMPHRLHAPVVVAAGEVNRLTLRFDESAHVVLEGQVTSEDGTPLSGLRVTAIDHVYTNSLMGHQGAPREIETLTDEEGRYRLSGVDRQAQGVELVSANGSDYGRAFPVFELEVPVDGVMQFDIVLPLAHDLKGWLVDANGEPVHRPGLEVVARPMGLDPYRARPILDQNLKVAVDGSFGREGLPEGDWVLYPLDFEAHGLVPFDPIEFRAEDGDLDVIVEAFDRNATRLELTVTDERSADVIGIANAVAILQRDGRRAPLVVQADSGIGENRATWNALPAGSWQVRVQLYGGRLAWRTCVIDGSVSVLSDRLVVESPGSLTATLVPGAVATALANEVVTARLIGPDWVDAGPDVESRFAAVGVQARVGSDGRIRFEDLPPGRYELRCASGAFAGRAFARVDSGARAEVKLPVEAARQLILTGDARPFREQAMRLRLHVRAADGSFSEWPVSWDSGVARAWLPPDAVAWEARWWSIERRGHQRSTPVSERVGGPLEGHDDAPIAAPLPR